MAKRGTLDHPKNRRLARALSLVPGASLGLLETIWHWVAKYQPTGRLTRLDLEDALDSGGWLPTLNVDDVIAVMTDESSQWLDAIDNGAFYIHDWHEHADDAVHMHLARNLKRFASGIIPNLKRFSREDRERLESAYAEQGNKQDAHDIHENAHGVRTECALPEPVPVPKPEPLPLPKPEPLGGAGDDDHEPNTATKPKPEAADQTDFWRQMAKHPDPVVRCLSDAAFHIPKFKSNAPKPEWVESVVAEERKFAPDDAELLAQVARFRDYWSQQPKITGKGQWWRAFANWCLRVHPQWAVQKSATQKQTGGTFGDLMKELGDE